MTTSWTKTSLAAFLLFSPLILPVHPAAAQAADAALTAAQVVQQSQAAYAALTSYRDEGRLSGISGATVAVGRFTTRLARPGLYRVDFTLGRLEASVWSPGSGNSLKINNGDEPREFPTAQKALAAASPFTFAISIHVPSSFFGLLWDNEPWPNPNLVTRKPDETLSGEDCFVITQPSETSTATFWIAKKDRLIRQIERDIDGPKTRAAMEAAAKDHPGDAPPDIFALGDKVQSLVTVESHFNIVVNQPIPDQEFEP